MKILFEGKVYETKLNQYGHVTSLDGKIFFGTSEGNILEGEIVRGEVYVEPEVIVDPEEVIPESV